MINKYLELLERLFHSMNLSDRIASDLAQGIGVITLLVVSFAMFLIVKLILKKYVGNLIRKTKFKYDDYFLGRKLERRLAFLVPVYMIQGLIYAVAPDLDMLDGFIYALARIGEITTYTGIVISITDSISDIYNSFDVSRNKPMKGFMQVAKIIAIMICILLVIGVLINKNMRDLLMGLGALSAVMMLVFKDPILGFVGGIQLTSNDMVRIGDWIVKGTADGEVIDVGLTTVKVKNWDNTIATIPTYTLISDPFINWRGMSESGGRRIARSIIIDLDTIKFCTPEMLEKYKKFQLVSKYIDDKEKEIEEYNNSHNIDTSTLVNGRRQTNLGIFRAYLQAYIKDNPDLNHNLTMLVRQKDPTEFGVPLQIYCFSAKTDWISYESIQNDIFDHVYAVVSQFDLKVYQRPSSYSINMVSEK
jgi:miniconductance mechanosensitive channel